MPLGAVDCVYVDGEVAFEKIKMQSAAHVAVCGVELALAQNGGGMPQNSAVPAQGLRLWHCAPGLDYIAGETFELGAHGRFIVRYSETAMR